MHSVDLAETARQITAEMVPAALHAGIDLGYEGPDHLHARCEAVLLSEMLKNLIDNAISYAGRGAIVTVRVQALPTGAVLAVEDNGPGLDLSRAPKRGQNLRQDTANTAKNGSAGYGLGLAICAEISALFGAEFHLRQGAENRGLGVEVVFPKGQGEAL
jgi:two-component system sensor histidine kinase TctE